MLLLFVFVMCVVVMCIRVNMVSIITNIDAIIMMFIIMITMTT